MYAKSLFALAFAFCAAASASAQDNSYEAQVTFAAGEQGQLMVPLPDAKRGAPDSMEIQMQVSLRGFAGIENTSKANGQGVLVTSFGADLNAGKQPLALGSSANFHRMGQFASFDGKVDFKGGSAGFFDQNASAELAGRRFAGKELAVILRNNKAKGLQFNVTGGAHTSLLGLESATVRSNLHLIVQVQVTYKYHEKPAEKAPGKTPAAPGKAPAPAQVDGKQAGTSTAIVSNKE